MRSRAKGGSCTTRRERFVFRAVNFAVVPSECRTGWTPRRIKTVPVLRSTSSQEMPRTSARRGPGDRGEQDRGLPHRASGGVHQRSELRGCGPAELSALHPGSLDCGHGVGVMSPSATAWRSAEPSTLRTWATVAAESPRVCTPARTARMWPGLTLAGSRPPMTGTISRRT